MSICIPLTAEEKTALEGRGWLIGSVFASSAACAAVCGAQGAQGAQGAWFDPSAALAAGGSYTAPDFTGYERLVG